jgi:hypothetical protein
MDLDKKVKPNPRLYHARPIEISNPPERNKAREHNPIYCAVLRAQCFLKMLKSGSKVTKSWVKLSKSGVKLVKTDKNWGVFKRFFGQGF